MFQTTNQMKMILEWNIHEYPLYLPMNYHLKSNEATSYGQEKNTMNFSEIPNSESDSPRNLPFVRSARERAWEPPRRWVKIQCGAPFAIAKLVNITSKAMVYDTYNISYKYSFKFHKHTYWIV